MKLLKLCILFIITIGYAHAEMNQMERFTKQVTIDKPITLKVNNPRGDIRIRKADDNQLIYHGVAQSQKSQEVTFEFKHEKNEIIAFVKYSNPDTTNQLDRYDLALIVPPMVSLEVDIEGGDLSTKGLGSAIKATSETSSFKITTSGPVELSTINGDIELKIKPTKKRINSTIKNQKGRVNVIFYDDMPRFEINTGSHVTSNSVPILKSYFFEKRTSFYGDEENKHHLFISTDTGQISLIDLAH